MSREFTEKVGNVVVLEIGNVKLVYDNVRDAQDTFSAIFDKCKKYKSYSYENKFEQEELIDPDISISSGEVWLTGEVEEDVKEDSDD